MSDLLRRLAAWIAPEPVDLKQRSRIAPLRAMVQEQGRVLSAREGSCGFCERAVSLYLGGYRTA